MPPAPSGTFRQLQQDTEFNGYTLPKGTNIGLPPWGFHRSRTLWGFDAKEWRPERWLQGRSVNSAKEDPTSGYPRWVPFSDGRQNCIGQYLATVRCRSYCIARH